MPSFLYLNGKISEQLLHYKSAFVSVRDSWGRVLCCNPFCSLLLTQSHPYAMNTHINDCHDAKGWFLIFPCETILLIWLLKENVAADTRKKALFIINVLICFWHALSKTSLAIFKLPGSYDAWWNCSYTSIPTRCPLPIPHLHPISPNLTECHRLQPQPNNCRADASLCLPPCFGRIDNSRFGLTAEGRNQKSCNRKHTVTAGPLKSWRRKMERWEEAGYCIVRSATEKVLYYVTGWWMAEQGGQD